MIATLRRAAVVAIAFSLPALAHALAIGQIDTFQSGIAGWFAGGGPAGGVPPIPPQVVANGGPTGANDAFLQLTSTGSNGPGGRLVGMNASQWAGNYLTAGFTTIEMDVLNLGPTELALRLLFEDPFPAGPQNIAITGAQTIAPGSGWVHVVFQLNPAQMTALLGSVTGALEGTTLLRIFHSSGADFPPDPAAAVVGIDNISAGFVPRPGPFPNAVPEPSSLLMLATALSLLGCAARRRRRKQG